MNEIVDLFFAVVPPARVNARGWRNFDCPACDDRRRRGGFLPTPEGGFKYRCFNGGCEFESPTGWSPGSPLGKRPRRLYELLGGDPADLPRGNRSGGFVGRTAVKLHTDFPTLQLPARSVLLSKAIGQDADDCRQYILRRFYQRTGGSALTMVEPYEGDSVTQFPFVWCPEYPRRVIIPLINSQRIIGWISRAIDSDNPTRWLKCAGFPTGFMFQQDTLGYSDAAAPILVMQNPFDAIAVSGIATFGSRLSIPQAALLKTSRRQTILVPDFKGNEWESYWKAAEGYEFAIACPRWAGEDGIKDTGEAIQRLGLLATIEETLVGKTTDYDLAYEFLRTHSR
jgi:hypothetical protein